MSSYNLNNKSTLTYKQGMSSADLFRYVKAVAIPVGVFALALIAIESLAGFGSLLVAPMTAAMWSVGAITAILLPSHRGSTLAETHVTIGSYLASLMAFKEVVALTSGVSSEMLMSAFNQAIPVTSGSAISGWLQTLMWIDSAMIPIGFIGMQVKRIFTFKRNESTQKTFDTIRGIPNSNQQHLR